MVSANAGKIVQYTGSAEIWRSCSTFCSNHALIKVEEMNGANL